MAAARIRSDGSGSPEGRVMARGGSHGCPFLLADSPGDRSAAARPPATAISPLAPVGQLDAPALEHLPQLVHVLAALVAHGRALLLAAAAQSFGAGGGTDAPLTALQDGDAGLVFPEGQLPVFRKDLLPLLRGDPAAAGLSDRLGPGAAGRSEDEGQGGETKGEGWRVHGGAWGRYRSRLRQKSDMNVTVNAADVARSDRLENSRRNRPIARDSRSWWLNPF